MESAKISIRLVDKLRIQLSKCMSLFFLQAKNIEVTLPNCLILALLLIFYAKKLSIHNKFTMVCRSNRLLRIRVLLLQLVELQTQSNILIGKV